MKYLGLFLFLIMLNTLSAQSKLSGSVKSGNGKTLPGVNVYLKGTFDGASSNESGLWSFSTDEKGQQVLVFSMLGFKTKEIEINLTSATMKWDIVLEETFNALEAVVISAGTFEASDERKAVVLKPLDIVTTASSAGDIYGALRTLPGTQQVGEDGRLFVRGGEAYETRTYMDGMLIQNPYGSQVPDIPARGRFSPLMFTGTIFSTGGYSAEYGQALSSALVLKTAGLAEKTQSGVSIMSVGGGLSHTYRAEKNSVSGSLDYAHLGPYFAAVKQNLTYDKAPQGFSGNVMHRWQNGSDGMLKVFASFDMGDVSIQYPSYDSAGNFVPVSLSNRSSYVNSVYTGSMGPATSWQAGTAASYNFDDRAIDGDNIKNTQKAIQGRFTVTHEFSPQYRLKSGVEYNLNHEIQDYTAKASTRTFSTLVEDHTLAGFAEAEATPSMGFAIRAGIRSEYSNLINKANIAPRLSMSLKTGANAQISAAYGRFFQTPVNDYVRFTHDLDFEVANHYILNYQFAANDRILRAEVWHKTYDKMVRYTSLYNPDPNAYSSDGYGKAGGFDLFWRDQKSISMLDYWVSYSYTDTKRLYRDYPVEATPYYVSKHLLSVVSKYYVGKINTQFGLTWTMASGRPYNNPNETEFMNGKTKPYYDLSANASYLTELFGQFTIIHLSVSNITGFEPEYGFHFSSAPGPDGQYRSFAISSPAKRFIFLGVFISID